MRLSSIVCFALVLVAATTYTTYGAGEDKPPLNPAAPARSPAAGIPLLLPAIAPDLDRRLAQYARTDLAADLGALSPGDRAVLAKILGAARCMDDIFLRQVWAGNPALRDQLKGLRGPQAEAARAYFDINRGPWDRLDGWRPFLGNPPHPDGAGFYPEDMTKGEFEAWLARHPGDRDKFSAITTLIRRTATGIEAVPYAAAYREWLEPAAKLLREAAAETTHASLKKFLSSRAAAFLSDDYYRSDMDWMDLDAPVEVTIGPYETYEDGLYGYKAAFEAFVTVALPRESAALQRYKQELPWLERNLPEPDSAKNLTRGTDSPIRVVDIVFTSGDANKGVQTIAYNLPNDERVRVARGSKKVLLRNIMRAKYEQILLRIAAQVLSPEDAQKVSFDAYFNRVLHHELSHGLGPGVIRVKGRKTEVRQELKELYAPLEEAKADIMGIYNILALVEKGVMPRDLLASLEPTFIADLFRSSRFGIHEAHGQGNVAQLNYLLAKGAIQLDPSGRFQAVGEKFGAGIKDLLHEMLALQAAGSYEGTRKFLDTWGKPNPQTLAAIDRLASVPVDIAPLYKQAEELAK